MANLPATVFVNNNMAKGIRNVFLADAFTLMKAVLTV